MKVKELIKNLQRFNSEAEITINCPNTNDTRNIWYLDSDLGDENKYVDIVMENTEWTYLKS